MPARRLSLHPMRLRPSPCGGDLRAPRRGRMPRLRGDARSRELRPNPIRPDTSRHRTVAASEGNPTPCAVDSAEAMPPTRTIPSHAPLALVALASLRAPGSWAPVRPACAGRLRRPPAFTGGPANRTATPTIRFRESRSAFAEHDAPPGTVRRTSCLRNPAAGAKGRFTRCSAKSTEISRTRGAFHR